MTGAHSTSSHTVRPAPETIRARFYFHPDAWWEALLNVYSETPPQGARRALIHCILIHALGRCFPAKQRPTPLLDQDTDPFHRKQFKKTLSGRHGEKESERGRERAREKEKQSGRDTAPVPSDWVSLAGEMDLAFFLAILRHLDAPPTATFLDIGCGRGQLCLAAARVRPWAACRVSPSRYHMHTHL